MDDMRHAKGPLGNIDEATLRELAPRAITRTFPRHAVIVNEGDETDSLYVMLSGRAKVFITGEDGRELVLSTIEPGDYFGEMVLDGGPRSASVMTLEPCRLVVIGHEEVDGLLVANPPFAHDLIRRLIARVRALTTRVRDLALKDVYSRFVRFVEEHAVQTEDGRVVPERLTQHDIAARIGGSRVMVSRIIRDLVAGGYIAVDAKHIRILKKLPPHW
jgi:CRP/FNR family cyclic AMP-dependent transcriptional regulator